MPATTTRRSRSRSSSTSASTTPLSAFRATAGTLTTNQRATIVKQAMAMIDGLYVHLPLKRAMHATDPLQRLRLLAQRLPTLSERQFHDELIDIFTDVRDLHTNYVLPAPFADKTAVLPFLVEEYNENGQLRYLVTKVAQSVTAPGFEPGITVTSWNGTAFDRAVEVNADRQAGSNLDARRARGLEAMTIRWLGMSPVPDEDWVIVGYTDLSGAEREVRFDWQVLGPDPAPNGVDPADPRNPAARKLGVDARFEAVRRAKKRLFNPKAVRLEEATLAPRRTASGARKPAAPAAAADESTMPDVFSFRPVDGPGGPYGYIRIWTFSVDDDGPFLDEFTRIAGLLPQKGLILDVRGNGGGLITAAENLLQLLTPHWVEPSRLSFRCTPLTLDLCKRFDFVSQWAPSIERSVETGELFSQALPLDDPAVANQRGQHYQGPVVLVTDALCYSATDIFAAGFQDNRIGPVLGASGNTGAGGANVWDHALLRQVFPGPGSPFTALPKGTSFRVSIRRITRAGASAGTPLEDLGVVPDEQHRMTQRDLMEGNADLIAAAIALLKAQPERALLADVGARTTSSVDLELTSTGIDRVDAWHDGRPLMSADVGASATLTLPVTSGEVTLEGYQGGDLLVVGHVTL